MKKDYQVADWIIQPELNCISKGAELVRLEPKVMQVLVELSARAGEVVHKEDLIHLVWSNTFVGDDVLIRCISELRRIFNDNPRSPRFIQTVSKVGYRLIAPVTLLCCETPTSEATAMPENAGTHHEGALATAPAMEVVSAVLEQAPAVPRDISFISKRKLWIVALVAIVLVVIGIGAVRAFRADTSDSGSFKAVPFTSYPGSERQPAFSPDGGQVAFTWNGEDGGEAWSLYVKLIGSETPLRLTYANAEDMSPAWSPDGKWIAFIRRSQQGNAIYMVPAIGGPERKLYDLHCAIDWDEPGLSWSQDGKRIVFPDGKSETDPSSIVSLSLDTLKAKSLTSPLNSWDGDYSPVVSPDGSKIAFVRGTDVGSRNVYVIGADGGEPKQLTFEEQQIHGVAWTSDGTGIVFSSNAAGGVSLWRVAATGGAIQRLPFGSDRAFTPAISLKNDRLVYSQGSDTWSVMRLDTSSPHAPAVRLVSSTEQDSAPQISNDGQSFAFQSRRSGSQEIWTSSMSNAAPVKLTSFNGPLTGSPSWSPDDKQIAFDSRTQGRSHIFVMDANGGAPRQLTQGEFNDIVPNWSRDGKWIYFSSKRSESWQIWKVNVNSGEIQQVTRRGGFVAKESVDGHWLYYTKYDMGGVWRMPLPAGDEVKLLDNPPQNYWAYFSVSATGIYFLNVQGMQSAVDFFDFARQSTSRLFTLARPPVRFSSLSVSQDGRWILYTDAVTRYRDLVLVENFH